MQLFTHQSWSMNTKLGNNQTERQAEKGGTTRQRGRPKKWQNQSQEACATLRRLKNFKQEIKILSYHLNSFHASNFCTSCIHASNLNPCIQWNELICFQLLLMKWWQQISKSSLIIFSDFLTFFWLIPSLNQVFKKLSLFPDVLMLFIAIWHRERDVDTVS